MIYSKHLKNLSIETQEESAVELQGFLKKIKKGTFPEVAGNTFRVVYIGNRFEIINTHWKELILQIRVNPLFYKFIVDIKISNEFGYDVVTLGGVRGTPNPHPSDSILSTNKHYIFPQNLPFNPNFIIYYQVEGPKTSLIVKVEHHDLCTMIINPKLKGTHNICYNNSTFVKYEFIAEII